MCSSAAVMIGMVLLGMNLVLPVDGLGQIDDMSGKELYEAACARCHGIDGSGNDPGSVAFEVPVPDFTSCSFATREPDADWIAVTHQGGPTRGFDETMPAFGDAIPVDRLQAVIDYVRGFCAESGWPRGELNLPRPLVTEKAYPEDEAVLTTGVNVEDPGGVVGELLYERRIGRVSQVEIKIPVGVRESSPAGDWNGGLGDVSVGFKRAMFHSLQSGSIFSLGGEVKIPTGDEEKGFGKGTTIIEPFLTFGQILPGNMFLHAQGVVELSTQPSVAEHEVVWRAVLGWSWSQGRWGRTWSPMVEVLGDVQLRNGSTAHWDVVPQLQVTLNTRQHVMLNIGVRLPVNDTNTRPTRLMVYILWDWFDGGFFQGW